MNDEELIRENDRRNREVFDPFDPITGENSIGERKEVHIFDFPIPHQFIPVEMMDIPMVRDIVECGSIRKYIEDGYVKDSEGEQLAFTDALSDMIKEKFLRLRWRNDFCFWAASLIYIKQKGGGDDILFVLNRPQRMLVTEFEKYRRAGLPIRIILLKARQWGGSTVTQLYFAWLQLMHKVGLNSLIVAQVKDTSVEIKDMFDRMMKHYPVAMLHRMSDSYDHNESKMVGVGHSGNINRIPQRNCKIKIGSAEKPDSARGGDYNLVHCSEVGLWTVTEGKKPEDIVRSACSGILLKPYTMIVYESTANGTGNFFQLEYEAAKNGTSQFHPVFIAWYDIEQYRALFGSEEEKRKFAVWLYTNRENRNVTSDREEPGQYLWWLWEKGATLEAIHWYIQERSKYHDHGDMASEYPSDDIEAFVHSGARVFDKYKVEKLKGGCRAPQFIGDVYGKGDEGPDCMKNLKFTEDSQGLMWIWEKPEPDGDEIVTDRYLTVVDVGGRSNKADWSVIVVFDRLYMMDGDKPAVVAQWYGHIDMDLLAWKAAQIAAYYNNSKLVIESNTLETHDKERDVDGDQSLYILNLIKDVYTNLYERKQSQDAIDEGQPRKYGFHTNVSTKPMVISTLIKVIREGMYVERDRRCLDEYITYEKKQNGAYGAITGKHDDLLMTRAIGLHICFFEMDIPRIVKKNKKVKHRKAVSAATIG